MHLLKGRRVISIDIIVLENMRQYIKKVIPSFRTILYVIISVLTIVNIFQTSELIHSSQTSTVQRASDKFPIESFVMVTQDIQFYEVVCDDAGTNCAPGSLPTTEMMATGSGVIIGEYRNTSLVFGRSMSSATIRPRIAEPKV